MMGLDEIRRTHRALRKHPHSFPPKTANIPNKTSATVQSVNPTQSPFLSHHVNRWLSGFHPAGSLMDFFIISRINVP